MSIRDFIRRAVAGSGPRSGPRYLEASGFAELGWLIERLRHRKSTVRMQAATALGDLGLVAASEALAAASRDREPLVRRAALVALLRIDPEQFAESAVEVASAFSTAAAFTDLDAVVEVLLRPRQQADLPLRWEK